VKIQNWSLFETLTQFSVSTLEMHEFSHFNQMHVHGGTKRKAELPPRPRKGKDVKKIRAALLGTASGAGSASGEKVLEAGLIELPEISVRKDISIDLPDTVVNSIDNMEVDHIVRTMVEFGSKALVLSRRVGSLYRREVKEVGEL